MSVPKRTSNRGGKRPGAGRSAILQNPVRKTIIIEQSMVDQIEGLDYNLSEFFRLAGEEKLQKLAKANG